MAIETVKRVTARIFKCGTSRVRILDEKRASEALTSDDVKALVSEGAVVIIQKKGVSRGKARFKQSRVHAGRRRGSGSSKGSKYALHSAKERWTLKARGQRKLLKTVKSKLASGSYRKVYRMIKGNNFRNKKHLQQYLQDNKLIASANKGV